MSDHYLVEGKLRVGMKWVRREVRGVREVLKVSRFGKGEKVGEYQGKLEERWNTIKGQVPVDPLVFIVVCSTETLAKATSIPANRFGVCFTAIVYGGCPSRMAVA